MAETATPTPQRTPSSAATGSAMSLPSLLPSPDGCQKRSDLLSLKQRLSQLLSPYPNLSELYWNGLTDFMLGKITRNELADVLERAFNPKDRLQAINLHNALLLSILYNTTRPTLPSSSIRHTGFHPRGKKRTFLSILGGGGDGDETTELQESRRKKIKESVMRVGRRERGDIKALGNTIGKKASVGEDARNEPGRGETVGQALRASRGGNGIFEGGTPKSLRDRETQGVTFTNGFTQEYNRLVQTPLCCESRELPDGDMLHDRMSLISYEEGLPDGVDGAISSLVSSAIDNYLKTIVASAISLIRTPSLPKTESIPSRHQPSLAAPSTFAPAGDSSPLFDPPPPLDQAHSPGTPPGEEPSLAKPLSIFDFNALFAIQPALLGPNGSTHSGAVERMYALPPQSDSEDSEECSDREENGQKQVSGKVTQTTDSTGDTSMTDDLTLSTATPASAPVAHAGKIPRLSTASRNRALSFYGSARPVALPAPSTSAPTGVADRSAFLLDPTSLHGVPEGHPDVPHVPTTISSIMPPLTVPTSSGSLSQSQAPPSVSQTSAATSNTLGGTPISPKSLSLRNALFPELAAASSSSAVPPVGSSANNKSKSTNTTADGRNRRARSSNTGNGTTTDEADSELDDLAEKIANEVESNKGDKKPNLKTSVSGGLKIKLGGTTTGTITPSNSATPGATGNPGGSTGVNSGSKTNEKDKEMGRKLWEVVDSVRLLDGVLDP